MESRRHGKPAAWKAGGMESRRHGKPAAWKAGGMESARATAISQISQDISQYIPYHA